ncbi:MAG: sulfatase, partial [Planctomycetes bacterium]|nr:sulfatase [Planctomycetota bacterium]
MKNWIVILTLLMPSAGWAAAKPNIIFMLSDDQGWNGLSVAMHPDVPASRG